MILILGYGLVGKALYKRLVSCGYQVKVFSRNVPTDKRGHFIEGNFENLGDYDTLFEGISLVVHTIHATVPATSRNDLGSGLNIDVVSTMNLFHLMKEKKIHNIVYLSSGGAVYGNPDVSYVKECHPTNPVSGYGISKLAIEKYIQLYHGVEELDYIILRPSNVFGMHQRLDKPQGILAHVVDAARYGKTIWIWGDGNGKKDYLYVDDVVTAISKTIEKFQQQKNKIFNVASGLSYSVNEIATIVERFWETKLNKRYTPPKDYDVQSIVLNGSRFNEAFDYKATMTIENFLELNHSVNGPRIQFVSAADRLIPKFLSR